MTSLTKALRKIAFARHQKLFLSRPKRTFHNCPSQCRFSSVSSTLDGALDGLYSLLNYKERAILEEQRRLTETSRKLASQVGGDKVSDLLHNTQSLHFLTDLNLQSTFSVAIAGEFNAGKSTIVNALLGSSLLESGSLPTTDTITIVAANQLSKRDDKATESVDDDAATNNLPLGVSLHSMQDLPLLQDLTFIDTPGTNSAWIDHTERTLRLLPSADLILFVTSADRPFSDSERSLLKNIQAYRKSIVIVINKMDILEENGYTEGAEKIINFVTDNASELLGARPIVIPVSGRNALKAKLEMKALPDKSADFSAHSDLKRAWKESNFASLESFLRDSLTTETRIRSKLTSPIGVAEGIMAQCLKTLKVEKKELQADNAALHLLKSQFDGWTKELSSDLNGINKSIAAIVEMEGQQGELVLSRINLYNFYAWTLTGSTANLEREWEETKRQSSLHRQQDLETELLDQVHEMA
jgi:small GTP-binding protein